MLYTVEKIINTRIRGGRREFLIKWHGYSSETNTWEPYRNIMLFKFLIFILKKYLILINFKSDKSLISEYNKEQRKQLKCLKSIAENKVEKIFELFINDDTNEMQFLVKFKENTEKELIHRSILNRTHPFDVINFYQSRIIFEKNKK